MKKILLVALNASYTHSNLALLCLKSTAGCATEIAEYTVNDAVSDTVREIVSKAPDSVCLSCYVWNIEYAIKVASTLKKILPSCLIILGGPEVSYNGEELMRKHAFIDIIIRGSGETPFSYFCKRFVSGEDYTDTPSAFIRKAGEIITTPDALPYDLNNTPFMYKSYDRYRNRIVYYETSRGCPFKCSYCMSAGARVSYLPLERVKAELEHFFKAGYNKVKFVDRTFNYPPKRGYDIIHTINELSDKYPLSPVSFHLEITASLLNSKILRLLNKSRKGLIQIEAGIQTTNPETLCAICRPDTPKTLKNIAALCRMDNIHVHCDLIAGLPYETYETFKKSFNDAYSLHPDTLQLGFLKLLFGSVLRETSEAYGLIYNDYPPYEILKTDSLSYAELSKLHSIESMLNLLYNSGLCAVTLKNIISFFESPFSFFERFINHLVLKDYFKSPKKVKKLFTELYGFAVAYCDKDILREALSLDWLRAGKGNWPEELEPEFTFIDKAQIFTFYNNNDMVKKYLPDYAGLLPKEISRRCYILVTRKLFARPVSILFDYGKREEKGYHYRTIDPADWR